jgi:hypothetical protein
MIRLMMLMQQHMREMGVQMTMILRRIQRTLMTLMIQSIQVTVKTVTIKRRWRML